MPGVHSNGDVSASQRERVSLYDRTRRAPLVRRVLNTSVVQRVLLPCQGDGSVTKFIRYSMVSAVAIVISQATILICAWVFGLSGIVANTIGALVATPASYELNRKWAWRKGGKSHLWREVVPFWALTFVGWLASTGTVEIADSLCQVPWCYRPGQGRRHHGRLVVRLRGRLDRQVLLVQPAHIRHHQHPCRP